MADALASMLRNAGGTMATVAHSKEEYARYTDCLLYTSSALKMTYYEAFSEARKALNSKEKTGSVGENIILQDNFDMKA